MCQGLRSPRSERSSARRPHQRRFRCTVQKEHVIDRGHLASSIIQEFHLTLIVHESARVDLPVSAQRPSVQGKLLFSRQQQPSNRRALPTCTLSARRERRWNPAGPARRGDTSVDHRGGGRDTAKEWTRSSATTGSGAMLDPRPRAAPVMAAGPLPHETPPDSRDYYLADPGPEVDELALQNSSWRYLPRCCRGRSDDVELARQ